MKIPKARKLESGNWFIQLRLGGESIPITAPTEKACILEAQTVKAEYLAGKRIKKAEEPPAPQCPTLTEAIDEYIARRDNILSPLTIRGYRVIQRNRFKTIMSRRLDDIEDSEWQSLVNREAGVCAPKTLKNSWHFIRSVVKEATGRYPPDVKLGAAAPSDSPFLNWEQITVFVDAVKDTRFAVPALLALSSLRVSEIAALDWKDVPPNPKFIRVSGAVVLDENNNKVWKPSNKTTASARNVAILIPELAAALERDRKPSGPLMTCTQNHLRRSIKKICESAGLPYVGIHGLRRSFASLAYHLRVPEQITMEMGGWDDITTMHKIYTKIAQSDITRYQTEMEKFYDRGR